MAPRSGLSLSGVPLSSVQFSHSVVSDSLRPHELQHARPPCPSPTPGVHSNSHPSGPSSSSQIWILIKSCKGSSRPTPMASLPHPLLLLPPIPPNIRVFSNESTLPMRWPKYWIFSFSISSFQRNPRADLLQNGLVGCPCSPRDSQESSPTPQFKCIKVLGAQLSL